MFGYMDRRHLPAQFRGGAGCVQFAGQPGHGCHGGAVHSVATALHRNERGCRLSGRPFHALKFGHLYDEGGSHIGRADDPANRSLTILRELAHG